STARPRSTSATETGPALEPEAGALDEPFFEHDTLAKPSTMLRSPTTTKWFRNRMGISSGTLGIGDLELLPGLDEIRILDDVLVRLVDLAPILRTPVLALGDLR